MVTRRKTFFSFAANFLRGRKCIFGGSFKILHTRRGYLKCQLCGKSKSLSRHLDVDVKVGTHVNQRMRAEMVGQLHRCLSGLLVLETICEASYD